MRLLAISDRHPPLRRSGAGSVLSELIEHLGRRHTVHTLSTDDPSFGGRLRWEAELQSSLRRLRPDVVLTLGVSVLAPGAPVVELLDGVPVRAAPGLDALRRRVGDGLRARAVAVIPTEPSRALLARGRDARVLPVGVDVDRFAPGRPPPPSPIRVVFLGRLIAERGAHAVVEAVQGLPTWARDRVQVDLVGAAEDPRYIETLRRRADGGPITIHPDVPDVRGLLQRAQLAVLPSTAEDGWGRAILECMAVGLPVVYSKGGVLDTITGGVAVPVAAGNLKPLGECLRDLLRHPEALAARGHAAREHVLAHHSWAVVGPQWEALLSSLVQAR